jgi:DNA-binding response OmpR family regulator
MKQILLVEDDPLYSKILSYILENNGYNVEVAGNGMQGMQMIKEKNYDLVVTDILMPFATGLDLLDQIKKGAGSKGTKVIILSIMSNEFYLSESLSRGADEYMRKPVTAKDLIQSVRRHLLSPAA